MEVTGRRGGREGAGTGPGFSPLPGRADIDAMPTPHRCFAGLALLLTAPALAAQARLTFDSAATVRYDPNWGLHLQSADGRQHVRFRAVMQGEFRGTDNAGPGQAASTATVRRARLQMEGSVLPGVAARVMVEIATARVQPEDVYVEATMSPALWLRLGRQRVPFGAERERLIVEQVLPERSLAGQLQPNRDVGITVNGDLARGRVGYTLGLLEGSVDNLSTNGDADGTFDGVARLHVWPRLHRRRGVPQGIRVGVAGMVGTQRGSTADPALPTYGTSAGAAYFAYRNAVADGARRRWNAFATVHEGPVGLLTEATWSRQAVTAGTSRADLTARSGSATLMVSLTGEPSQPGGLVPRQPFDPAQGRLGAVQLAVRVARLTPDADAFPVFADPALAAGRASSVGAGLTWYLNRLNRLQLGVERTAFTGGAATGNRPADTSGWLRWQVVL